MSQQLDRSRSQRDASADPRLDPECEELFLRSHDHRRGYDLTVEVLTPDGESGFERRYYLQPGETVSELDALPGGEFEVRVTMDNRVERSIECRIGTAPEETAVIEVGNGALSLTEGLSA